VGGAEGMRALMYDFYDIIYESDIAHFFPQDEDEFEEVKLKIQSFLYRFVVDQKFMRVKQVVWIWMSL
jgi:hypothetical protein